MPLTCIYIVCVLMYVYCSYSSEQAVLFFLLFQPFCSLHLQLQISENPYLSGTISTKSSAPGIIVATGETKVHK